MLEKPSSGSNEKPKPTIDVRFEKRVDAVMAEAAESPIELGEPEHPANSQPGRVDRGEVKGEIKFIDPNTDVLETHPEFRDLRNLQPPT